MIVRIKDYQNMVFTLVKIHVLMQNKILYLFHLQQIYQIYKLNLKLNGKFFHLMFQIGQINVMSSSNGKKLWKDMILQNLFVHLVLRS